MTSRRDDRAFAAFLENHRARVEPLEIALGEAWWDTNLTDAPAAAARAAVLQKRLTRVYADRPTAAWLGRLDTTGWSADATRQHKLLRDAFTANQMDDAAIEDLVDTEKTVEAIFNNVQPLLRGVPATDNRLREILRDSDDPDLRRDAWEASKQVGAEVETPVRRLVARRNREARRLGFPNYFSFSLTLQELDETALLSLLADLDAHTRPLWATYKAQLDQRLAARFRTAPDALRPWHFPDPFFQDAPPGDIPLDGFFAGQDLPACAAAFFGAIGLDIRDVLARSDLFERPGKSQHAFCLHVGRFDDVRVLCNCTPGERWMSTLLHEFGHAVYNKHLGDGLSAEHALPFFLRDTAHTLVTEAVALLMGRFSRSGAWLRRYAGISDDEARRIEASARAEERVQLLVQVRWCLVMVHFERALYADPEQNLNRLWWHLVQTYQNIAPPDDRDAPDWAAKIHLALAPVYYHNYLLGELLASQLLDTLRRRVLPPDDDDDLLVRSSAVGTFLRRAIFAHGARLPWDMLIREATGEPLNSAHFVRELGRHF